MPALVDVKKCEGFGACVSACPVESISMADGMAKVDPDKCVDCGARVDACPIKAITL
ncbi:MAG: ferredoxin [Thermoplasmata archaeon HGW-Thermoplasmata-1]|nr:MAG: ferredoxin [Thermoplasmata archaeon HGW-Thermoplasmata-1]